MKILLKDSDMFFEKNKNNINRDAIQIILLAVLFSFLTTLTIYEGWTTTKLTTGFVQSFIGITIATVSGILILIVALMLMAFRKINRTCFDKTLFIVAYAATPALIIGWVPHGFVKIVAILWSLIFIKVGLEVSLKKSQKQATLVVIGIAIILAIMTLATQTYLISPL
ncbi:MAG: Yip1 family protein [Candidatus Aenigmatarchaeota archaeon]